MRNFFHRSALYLLRIECLKALLFLFITFFVQHHPILQSLLPLMRLESHNTSGTIHSPRFASIDEVKTMY